MMALPSSVFNDLAFKVLENIFLEYPEITSPEQGLKQNDTENCLSNRN